MTPTKRTGKEAGDTRKQPLRKATAATANLTEMTSELEVARPSSGKSSPKKTTKRPVTLEEVESSTKKLKLPQEDTSDEEVGIDTGPRKRHATAGRGVSRE